MTQDPLAALTRGTEHVHSKEELAKKLALGRPLRVKFGVDPTAPDIHLGHTVPLLKLRAFQDLGHHAVLIIGDFTASIGDPTGRDSTRPELSREAIAANAATYQDQAFKVLDPAKTEVVYNGTWFNKMTAVDLLQLQRRGSATQMLQRRDFQERREAGKPIAMHELTYPSSKAGTPWRSAPTWSWAAASSFSTSSSAATCRSRPASRRRSS